VHALRRCADSPAARSTWFFVSWKNRVVRALVAAAAAGDPSGEGGSGLARIAYPLSSLLSWAVVSGGAVASLAVYGINVQPLLALGSVSTLAVGFAAQSTVANVVSAFSLHASRPFIAGDRVALKSMSGAAVAAGTVQRIMPLHTVIRTDAGTPMYVHNKDLASSMLIINESKLARAGALPAPPGVEAALTLRYADVDAVAGIEAAATAWMEGHPDLDPGAHRGCCLEAFGAHGPVLAVRATIR
jgi:MscS family membrane protein